jgi:hypothetical protein
MTRCCGPSVGVRSASLASEPMMKLPAGTTTISGHRSQSTKLSPGLSERSRRRASALPALRVPLGWATTQNNLGNALSTLGVRESGTARLEEAVVAYRGALMELTRARVPLDWATTQNNLGNTLQTLGERESGLEEAVVAYRDALSVFESAAAAYFVEVTHRNLARVEGLLMQRRKG